MEVMWCKCLFQSNCRLNSINLNSKHFEGLAGIYVIWHGNEIVSVGKGIIKDELSKSRADKEVQQYGSDLSVTWGAVPDNCLDGVEAFLLRELKPLVKHTLNAYDLIDVNLPVLDND